MTPEFALTIAAAGVAYVGIASIVGRLLRRASGFLDQSAIIADELDAERAGYVRLSRQSSHHARGKKPKLARGRGADGVRFHGSSIDG